MRLVGDIGGTKALLGLVDETTQNVVTIERLACAEYSDFAPLLQDFLSAAGLPGREVSGGCLAVAGPLADDSRSARLTNLPWVIDADALSKEFGIGRLKLVNDFSAAALGVTQTGPHNRVVLQTGEPMEFGVRVVLGAGTGLGMATLVLNGQGGLGPAGQGWTVLAGEGGHAAFAPTDEVQTALCAHLRAKHGRATYEHVVSGPGLVEVYRFLAGDNPDAAILDAPVPAAAISSSAISSASADSIPRRAIELFMSAYGAFAGDMALALMARGGVYLAGGIAASILPLMQSGTFVRAFNAKAAHSTLALRMPVYVVTDPELGLKGAAVHDRLP